MGIWAVPLVNCDRKPAQLLDYHFHYHYHYHCELPYLTYLGTSTYGRIGMALAKLENRLQLYTIYIIIIYDN